MILTTVQNVPGRHIQETLGLVTGSSVQSKPISADLKAGFKTIIGGELDEYTDMVEKTRIMATTKMMEAALALGANAIIGIHYTTSSIVEGAAEILVYGTAVRLEEGGSHG